MSINVVLEQLKTIEDPRADPSRNVYELADVLMIALCATLAGCNTYTAMVEFAKIKIAWFSTFLTLKNGIPSHDTMARIFTLLDPEKLEATYEKLLKTCVLKDENIIAVDGKTIRRSHDGATETRAAHIVSAWSTENGVSLGQVKTDQKSNEITAIPELLETISVKNAMVTIDAMGCQTKIAEMIIDGGGDYLFGLKGNQKRIHKSAIALFYEITPETEQSVLTQLGIDYHRSEERGHGRHEIRHCYTTNNLDEVDNADKWKGLEAIGMVISQTTRGSKVSTERRQYITSRDSTAEKFGENVRNHWAVENSLHWVLDVAFNEDHSRARMGNAAQNLTTLRRLALNMIKRDTKTKAGIEIRRQKAGWDEQYLMQCLTGCFE